MKTLTSSRKCLTLQKKVELIKTADRYPGISMWSLAEQFECGKTQIAEILKKVSLLSMYEANISKSAVQTKTSRTSQYSDVNKALYNYFFNLASSIQ